MDLRPPVAEACLFLCSRRILDVRVASSKSLLLGQVRPLTAAEKAAKGRHRVFVQRPGTVQLRALRFGGSTAGHDEVAYDFDRVYMMAGKEHAAQLYEEMVGSAVTGSFLKGVNTLVRTPCCATQILLTFGQRHEPCRKVPGFASMTGLSSCLQCRPPSGYPQTRSVAAVI